MQLEELISHHFFILKHILNANYIPYISRYIIIIFED